MASSQNGWPVDPPRSARTIPGTSVRVTVADGAAGDVLMYVLGQFDKRVEDIDLKSTRGEFDDWGYANRNVRGSTSVSNHASATAVDVNATRHVLGARGTFTAKQVAEIHKILAEVDHVVRWGGDYSGRKDEMHFEINAGKAAVERVAARLREGNDMSQQDVDNINGYLWRGGETTGDGDPSISPESLMGRVQNLEGFLYKGGPSTRDWDNYGVSPDSVMGRLKANEVDMAEIKGLLNRLVKKMGA